MSKRMFKYRVPIADRQTTLELRVGSSIVSVGSQNPTEVCLWVEVPDIGRTTRRTFTVVATGEDVPLRGVHLGTVQDGALVWHVYEVPA